MTLILPQFLAKFRSFLDIARTEKDEKAIWYLRFRAFQHYRQLNFFGATVSETEAELLEMATKNGFEIEQIVAKHYFIFGKHNTKKISNEQLYAHILSEFESMKTAGLENFRAFDIARLLYHSGHFLFELDDFEKAQNLFLAAEPFTEATSDGFQIRVFVLNHLGSIYQRQKNYSKGIEYAKKILDLTQKCPSERPDQVLFCKTWRGIASIDIASMLVGTGQFLEGEFYATEGYELLKTPLDGDILWLIAEFDMLQTLVPIKLELGKLEEAKMLLRRGDELASVIDRDADFDFFKHLRFYENQALFYEKTGDFEAAVRFPNRAKPLRDSLERRNDARKFEKIKQRLDGEKYAEKIALVETEKRLQLWLRNAAILILLLVAGLALGNFHRLHLKRRQALADLDQAQKSLEKLTANFREKADLAETLRLEIERLAGAGERTEALEKLTHSTILTDSDWADFRSLFEKVHPDFIQKLKIEQPDLTGAEVRLLALEKLELSAAEMAAMLGISKSTIHQTRYRLNKKMG